MSFDDKWVADALDKYMKSTRAEAPYLPNNVDYIAANNALTSREDVSGRKLSITNPAFN
jgi:urea carboxylase